MFGHRVPAARCPAFGLALVCGMLCAAGASGARAHAFTAGADTYLRFVEGAAVPFSAPAVALCLVPFGLLVGAWRRDGLPAVWPALLVGLGVGIAVAPLVAPWISFLTLGAGALCASAAALAWLPLARIGMAVVALIVGLLATSASLEGHALGEVPVATLFGVFFGANLTVALPAAMVSSSIEHWWPDWTRIGWRIVSSWSGAIALIYLAFEVRPLP